MSDQDELQGVLEGMPRWARVAFAVRCARSVLHLAIGHVDPIAGASRLGAADVLTACNIADWNARRGGGGSVRRAKKAMLASELALEFVFGASGLLDDAQTLDASERGDQHAVESLREAEVVSAAASAARHAALAAHHAASTSAELSTHELQRVDGALVAAALRAYSDAVRSAHSEGRSREDIANSLARDCRHLHSIAQRDGWDDESRVRVDVLDFYSCFISYSTRDEELASRLHAGVLQAGGSCWKWDHDARGGHDLWVEIERALLHQERVALLVSESALGSPSVRREVELVLAEAGGSERDRVPGSTLLLPLLLDDFLFEARKDPLGSRLRQLMCIDATEWRQVGRFDRVLGQVLLALRKTAASNDGKDLTFQTTTGELDPE